MTTNTCFNFDPDLVATAAILLLSSFVCGASTVLVFYSKRFVANGAMLLVSGACMAVQSIIMLAVRDKPESLKFFLDLLVIIAVSATVSACVLFAVEE